MLKRYFAVWAVLAACLLFACKNAGKNGFQVTLSYTNADKLVQAGSGFPGSAPTWVYLEEIVYGKDQAPLVVDSAKLAGAAGNIALK